MALIQARIDDVLKSEVEDIFQEIGIDTPTALRMFFKAVVRYKGLPFDLCVKSENTEVVSLSMAGTQLIIPDEKKAGDFISALQCEGYSAALEQDTDGWRIRIGERIPVDSTE